MEETYSFYEELSKAKTQDDIFYWELMIQVNTDAVIRLSKEV